MEKKDAKGTQKLSFTLTTSNNPELIATAEILKTEWEAIGAKVTVVSIEPSVLSETVIRPRKYDALLFGEVIGRGEDLYPFWYSGERKDPGLNIALYTNSKADSLLQKARTATSSEETSKQLSSFADIIKEDIPAVFLYSPEFIYVIPNKIKGLELPALEMAHERFSGILSSYINAKKVWK
jgi:peptide/nickel transport system substrate-binding protein